MSKENNLPPVMKLHAGEGVKDEVFVSQELLERALTAWLQEAREANNMADEESVACLEIDEDYLHVLFANEFPELSFKIIGTQVVIL